MVVEAVKEQTPGAWHMICVSQALEEKGKKIGADLDAVLDTIDDVLEENAAEFVRDYVQHGGQ